MTGEVQITEEVFMKMSNDDRKQWLEFMKVKLEWARINSHGENMDMKTDMVDRRHVLGLSVPLQHGHKRKRDRLSLPEELLMDDRSDAYLSHNPLFQARVAAIMDVSNHENVIY